MALYLGTLWEPAFAKGYIKSDMRYKHPSRLFALSKERGKKEK